MSLLQIDDRKLDTAQLARLTQEGPVIVTHDGKPLFVAHTASPEWLEAWAAEESKPGPMQLKEYAERYNIPLDADAYRREFPEYEPSTHPADEE